MQDIRAYIKEAFNAYNQKDKDGITELIMLQEGTPRLVQLQESLYNITEDSIRSVVQSEMKNAPHPLRDFITNYLLFSIASALDTSAFGDVFDLLSACYGNFLSLYLAQDAQWLTPLLMNLSYSLVDWAIMADKENPHAKELKISEAAAKHLTKAFNIVISDKVPNAMHESKKMALYYLANLAFRAYFKLRSTRLLATMLANISKAGVRLADYPMSQQVAHRYYLGRYHLYQQNLRSAERDLSFAYRNCPELGQDQGENEVTLRNSQLILIYLTACRLCLGRMPSVDLLRSFELDHYFLPLMSAVKSGDLSLLQHSLGSHENKWWLVRKEIYLLLKEKLTVLCWRSLIRRTCLVTPRDNPAQFRVQLADLVGIVRSLTNDPTYDILDIESITASLLDQGYIKGYIHSQKKILVLGKTNPFPTVYSVEVNEEVM